MASMLTALSGLTIIPSLSMADASGSWGLVGIEGGWLTPAASTCHSCLRGGVSVSLALTDVPSLSSFSPFAGGLGGEGAGARDGGGAGTVWTPSRD